MIREYRTFLLLVFLFVLILMAGCAPAVEPPTVAPTMSEPSPVETVEPPPTPERPSPFPSPTGTEGPIAVTPTPVVEERFIEVEWPPNMRLGDSDIVRLSLIPAESGYLPQVEFEEHELEVDAAEIPFRSGFEAFAIARLNAVGLLFSSGGDQEQRILQSQILNWRWSISPESAGRHRLNLQLRVRWEPLGEGRLEEVNIWDSAIEVQVSDPLGIAAPQARVLGAVGILVGGAMALTCPHYLVHFLS